MGYKCCRGARHFITPRPDRSMQDVTLKCLPKNETEGELSYIPKDPFWRASVEMGETVEVPKLSPPIEHWHG